MHVTHPYIPCLLSEPKKKLSVVQLNSSEFIQSSSSIHPSIHPLPKRSERDQSPPAAPTHTGPLETLVKCASLPPQRPEAAKRPGSFEAAADAGKAHIICTILYALCKDDAWEIDKSMCIWNINARRASIHIHAWNAGLVAYRGGFQAKTPQQQRLSCTLRSCPHWHLLCCVGGRPIFLLLGIGRRGRRRIGRGGSTMGRIGGGRRHALRGCV
jgi:hypothetical protein